MSSKLRVGIVGTSHWADEFYLSNLRSHPNVILSAVSGFWGPPPASEIAGLRRGLEQAETLQIPDKYYDNTNPELPMELFKQGSYGPRAFIDAVLNDLPVSPSFYDGYRVQQVIDATLESDKTGDTVVIDNSL